MTIHALDHLLPRVVTFPAQPGTYTLKRFVPYFPPEGATGEKRPGLFPGIEQEAEVTLLFSRAASPAELFGIEALAELPLLCGTVQGVSPAEVKKDGETYYHPTKVWFGAYYQAQQGPFYVVPANALRAHVWARYARSLESLGAFHDAVRAPLSEPLLRPEVKAYWAGRDAALQKAYGIAPDSERRRLLWFVFAPLEPKEADNLADYYPLSDALTLLATLDLIEAGDVKQPLPPGDCALAFSLPANPEQAEVLYCEGGMCHPPLPFRGQPGAVENDLRALFRKRARLAQLADEIQQLLIGDFLVLPGKTETDDALVYARQEIPSQETQQAALRIKQAEAQRTAQEIGELYLELAAYAARQKEAVLSRLREREATRIEVRSDAEEWKANRARYVEIASNIRDLPAHFAAVPAGLMESHFLIEADQFGRSVLKLKRPGLDLSAAGTEHRSVDIQLPAEHAEQAALLEQTRLLFMPGGPRWFLPQGLVAISKLYREKGGYSNRETPVRIYLNEFIDTMRPHQVARFKEKGRSEAFGKEYAPRVLFDAMLGTLSRLTFPDHNDNPVHGVFFISRSSGERDRDYFVEIMLNPAQYELLAGERAMYMVTNAEAMMGYDRASLDYAPAAQLGLELFARQNIKTDTATICTPEGGGIRRLALANMFGLLKGPKDRAHHVLQRFNRVLSNLQDAGVIAEVKLDGRESSRTPFETKVLITLNDDYRKAYNLTRKMVKLATLERQLEAPFAAPKALPKAEPPPTRRRGRPKGSKKAR